jgi:hypothetical protein
MLGNHRTKYHRRCPSSRTFADRLSRIVVKKATIGEECYAERAMEFILTSALLTKCLRRWFWVSRSSKRMNTNVLTQRCLLNPIELMLDLSVGTYAHFSRPAREGKTDLASAVILLSNYPSHGIF